MKKYEAPEIDYIYVTISDIIKTSELNRLDEADKNAGEYKWNW